MVVIYLDLFLPLMILLVLSQKIGTVNYSHHDCRYHFHVEKLKWMEAYNVCKDKNMSLLQLNHPDEITTLQSLHFKVNHLMINPWPKISSVWIGLYATSQSGNVYYFWPDCEQPTSIGHLPASLHGHSAMCGVFNASLNNYFADCDEALPYVCEETESDQVPCFFEETLNAHKSFFSVQKELSIDDNSCAENCFNSSQSCAAFMMSTSCLIYARNGTSNSLGRSVYYVNNIVDWFSYPNIASTIPPEDVCSMTSSMTVPLTSTDVATLLSFNSQLNSMFSLHHSTFSYDTSDSSLITPSLPTISNRTLTATLTSVLPSTSSCFCTCHLVSNVTYTPEELQQKIEQIKSELTISTKKTNKYKRSLISAPDNRPSARGLGSLGIIVIGIIITILVAFDFPRAARNALKIARKGKKRFHKQSAT